MATVVMLVFVFKTAWCRLPLPEDCPFSCSCNELTLTVNCSYLDMKDIPSMRNNTRVLLFDGNGLKMVGTKLFSHMGNLRMLTLANNAIDEIHENAFKNTGKVVHLDISGNRFGEVPIALNNLRILKELNLRDNQIRTLSKEPWSNLSRLNVLLVDNNNTTNLPIAMTSKLKRLTNLSLSYNHITTIAPGQFLNNSNLLYLDLSYNRITTKSNAYLEDIFQSSNVPTAPPEEEEETAEGFSVRSLKGLFNLRELNLAGNEIQLLENGIFSDLHSLEILNLDYNGLEYIQDMVFRDKDNSKILTNKIRILTMSHNALDKIPHMFFEDLRDLEVLFLDHNRIVDIFPLTNVHMFNLQLLHLEYNKIQSIDQRGFAGYRKLEEIFLQGNKLKHIPEVRNLSRLHTLDLSYNRIVEISPIRAFEGTRLSYINLEFNRLQNLPIDTFRYLHNLNILRVEGNRYVCDCTMTWIVDYFNDYAWLRQESYPSVLPIDSQVICQSPRLVSNLALYDTIGKQLISKLQCTKYADPHRVMLLISAWGGFVAFALIVFWLYTYFDFKTRFYVRKPRKRYLLLHNPDTRDNYPLTGNHSKVRFRSFDSESESYIYDEETTV